MFFFAGSGDATPHTTSSLFLLLLLLVAYAHCSPIAAFILIVLVTEETAVYFSIHSLSPVQTLHCKSLSHCRTYFSVPFFKEEKSSGSELGKGRGVVED